MPFVGRKAEVTQLEQAHARATQGQLVYARIVGEEGVGKRRLVAEVMEAARRSGELVVEVVPDPHWAGVPY